MELEEVMNAEKDKKIIFNLVDGKSFKTQLSDEDYRDLLTRMIDSGNSGRSTITNKPGNYVVIIWNKIVSLEVEEVD